MRSAIAFCLAAFFFAPGSALAAGVSPSAPPPPSGASSEDTDTPGAPAAGLPFYYPNAQEQSLTPPPPGMPFMFTLLEDAHSYTSGSNYGSETRLRFGKDTVGLTVGMFGMGSAAELGVDFLRYMGVQVASKTASFAFDVFVLVPNIDLRGYYGSGGGGAVAGTSLSGVRLANCALTGCFEVSLRLPTVDVWYNFGSSQSAVSIGAGGSIGVKL